MKTGIVSITATIVFLSLLSLAGCAIPAPSAVDAANADFGTPITQEEAQNLAQKWLANVLKDPESARYEWTAFDRGWTGNSVFEGGGYTFGYRLEGTVNAKNSFGGYVGRRKYVFMFRNGAIASVWGEEAVSGRYRSRLYMRRMQ